MQITYVVSKNMQVFLQHSRHYVGILSSRHGTLTLPANDKTEREIMSEQLLRNPDIEPTDEVLHNALGKAYPPYVSFLESLAPLEIENVWRYYPDGSAWLTKGLYRWTGPRGGKKETTTYWLGVWEDAFRVTVYFPMKHRETVLEAPVSAVTLQMIADAQQLGKLKFFPVQFEVTSKKQLTDIIALVKLRKELG